MADEQKSKSAELTYSGTDRFSQLYGSVIRCTYKVQLGDINVFKDIDGLSTRIESIKITERLNGSDSCTIVINDPDFNDKEKSIINNALLKIGDTKVRIDYTWSTLPIDTPTDRTFIGYISAMDIDFPESGIPTLTLTCLDSTHDLNTKKHSKTWEKKTNADVVKEVCKGAGISCEIEKDYKFSTKETITQSNQTDIAFLEGLARSEFDPFICKVYMKGDKSYLKYVRKHIDKDAVACFAYMQTPFDIISFSPRINREVKKEDITEADINTATKTPTTETASSKVTPRLNEGGSTIDNKVFFDAGGQGEFSNN